MIVNICKADVPPPGVGVTTLICALPPAAISLAGIAAVSCVAPINVVGRSAPFQRTFELGAKLVPVAVSVKAAPPVEALTGAIEDSPGTGLSKAGGGDALIVNASAGELPPPGAGLNPDTCAEPAAVMSPTVMAAVSCVALTKLVGRSAPSQRTLDALEKFEPFTESEKAAPPAVILAGAIDDKEGTGLLD